ncbi:MAG: E2/UBC family protein [Terriglobales bacterium]
MALPPRLAKEIEQLELKPEVAEDGSVVNLVFRDYPVPPGYNRSTTDLLVRIPLSYPDAGPDMFWTSPVLTLANGAAPQGSDLLETYMGQQWRRFSWHTIWRPNIDNLHSYMHFVRRRLERSC